MIVDSSLKYNYTLPKIWKIARINKIKNAFAFFI